MIRLDRYVVNTSADQDGITTNDKKYAEQVAAAWGVEVIDTAVTS